MALAKRATLFYQFNTFRKVARWVVVDCRMNIYAWLVFYYVCIQFNFVMSSVRSEESKITLWLRKLSIDCIVKLSKLKTYLIGVDFFWKLISEFCLGQLDILPKHSRRSEQVKGSFGLLARILIWIPCSRGISRNILSSIDIQLLLSVIYDVIQSRALPVNLH